jgi:RNA polymerase sigma-70 factor (ECF subfamily)
MTAHAFEDVRDLIRLIAEGDHRAFERLYDRYAQLVLNLAVRILRNQADAEEVVQEVFWQVWRNAAQYDPDRGPPEAWLFTLARTRAIDALRSSHKEGGRADVELSEADIELSEAAVDPTGLEVDVGDKNLVVSALTCLSKDQRRALELAYYEGLTQTEIAASLGVPLGTVKSWVRRGLEQLRETLVARGWSIS